MLRVGLGEGGRGESAELVMKTKPQEPRSINKPCLREAAPKEMWTRGLGGGAVGGPAGPEA